MEYQPSEADTLISRRYEALYPFDYGLTRLCVPVSVVVGNPLIHSNRFGEALLLYPNRPLARIRLLQLHQVAAQGTQTRRNP